jgi:methionyl-tRNA formyltransferase
MTEQNIQKKKLVILTTDSYEQRYVANHLCDHVEIAAIFIDTKQYSRKKKAYFKKGLLNFFGKVGRTLFLKLTNSSLNRQNALIQTLGDTSLFFKNSDIVQEIQGLNTEETSKLIQAHNPDAILVYGTRIVKDHILDIANDLAFNMHTGISPYYRGTACAFWPVVNGEYDMVGATVHECTSAVDGGKIFAVQNAVLEKGDNIHTVFARAVKAGADAYVHVIKDYVDGKLTGESQDLSIGKEYRGFELTLRPEIKARLNMRKFNR